MTVESGDDELGCLLQAVERFVGVEAEVVLELRGDRVEHLDVRAGGEELVARPAQQEDVDAVVEARLEDRLVEVLHHLVGEGVHGRVVQRDGGHAGIRLVFDEGIFHGKELTGTARRASARGTTRLLLLAFF